MLHATPSISSTSLTVATLGADLEEAEFLRQAFAGLQRWDVSFETHEGVDALLAATDSVSVDLLVLNGDEGPELSRKVRQQGYDGAILAHVGADGQARGLLRAGVDATLKRDDLDEPILLESITRVALTKPHRGV